MRVWSIVRADNAASLFSSHEVRASDAWSDIGVNPEYAGHVACSIILQGFVEVQFECETRYQEDSPQMWSFLHERYISATTCKATVHAMLAQKKYTGQPMHEYVAKLESCSAHPASLNAGIDEGVLVTMITESFGDCLKSPY